MNPISSSMLRLAAATALTAVATFAATPADASLTVFNSFFGSYGLSTDGGFDNGSTHNNLVVNAPVGAVVESAYLYTSRNKSPGQNPNNAVTLNGSAVNGFGSLGVLPLPACCTLEAWRTNVTNIVKPVVDGGAGGAYTFQYRETNTGSTIDGSALVVVFSKAGLPNRSIGIYDGFSNSAGDNFSVNLGGPLNKTPDFSAEMRLGIGFSVNNNNSGGQVSTVTVNGNTLTTWAGNPDDGISQDGGLITVGGDDDPIISTPPANISDDHERYNLTDFLANGITQINLRTLNPSNNDNIFLAVFDLGLRAGFEEPPPPDPCIADPQSCVPVNNVPEPGSLAVLASAIAGWTILRRRRRD